jgi:hypothetical protein
MGKSGAAEQKRPGPKRRRTCSSVHVNGSAAAPSPGARHSSARPLPPGFQQWQEKGGRMSVRPSAAATAAAA